MFLSPTAALETLTLCFYSPHRPCVPLSHCSFRNIDTLFPMASQALYAYDISHCSFRNRDTMFLFASQAAYSCLWITALGILMPCFSLVFQAPFSCRQPQHWVQASTQCPYMVALCCLVCSSCTTHSESSRLPRCTLPMLLNPTTLSTCK